MARMRIGENRRRLTWCLLLFSLVVCWGVWRWATDILIPTGTARAIANGKPVGNMSDLYPRWLGAREALLHHRNPYSPEVTREIQTGFYGRPLDAKRPADPRDQVGFAYPLYVVFLLAPTVGFRFSVVTEYARWFLLFGTAVSVPLWVQGLWARGFGLRFSRLTVLATMVLALSTFTVVEGFHEQQLTLLVGLLLAAAAAAAARGWLALSGFLLALSTIKPQISGLLIFWFMVWVIGEWNLRQRLAWGFAATMAALLAGAELLQPGWIRQFALALREYQRYAGNESFLQVLLTPLGGWIAAAALLAFLIVVSWRWRKTPAGSEQFGWAIALATGITLAILNKTAPYNQVLLIPALLMLAARFASEEQLQTSSLSRSRRAAIKAPFACLLWQWGAALVLSLASLVVPVRQLGRAIPSPLYTVLALPVAVLLAVLLTMPRAGGIVPAKG
jgi:hypothetical protein